MSVMPKSFMNGTTLNRHVMSHAGEKPYKCKLCEKSFTSRYTLKTHAASHAGDKPWNCQFCEKSFIQNSYLKVHMRTHTGEKLYTCKTCQKLFKTVSVLNSHSCMLIQTGDLPYLCVLCNKRFACVTRLKKHKKTHAAEEQQILHMKCSSLNLPRHHAGTQPRCPKLDNSSPALSGTAVIDKPNECPVKTMPPDSGEENILPSSYSGKECQSMFI